MQLNFDLKVVCCIAVKSNGWGFGGGVVVVTRGYLREDATVLDIMESNHDLLWKIYFIFWNPID